MATALFLGVESKAKKVKNIYIGVDGKAKKVKKAWIGDANGKAKLFYSSELTQPTYTGTWEVTTIGNYKYMYLKDSGTLTINDAGSYDLFCVGGGASGARYAGYVGAHCGGSSGKTATALQKQLSAGTALTVTIGAGGVAHTSGYQTNAGGATSIGSLCSAVGATNAGMSGTKAGTGGSGGGRGGYASVDDNDNLDTRTPNNGGSDGDNADGTGQGTTTRAFGESSGTLYAGGGGGGFYNDAGSSYNKEGGSGGSGGGGKGSGYNSSGTRYAAVAGTNNTGGGGGGGANGSDKSGAAGGSGLAIIRWKIA